jgi:hypothetical protein
VFLFQLLGSFFAEELCGYPGRQRFKRDGS